MLEKRPSKRKPNKEIEDIPGGTQAMFDSGRFPLCFFTNVAADI